MIKLYDLAMSGNCYKIRLFLSLLGIEYTKVPVDIKAGDIKSNEFLEMNPNGLVPVLVDNEITIYDSAAILSYLAKTYADQEWFPVEPATFAKVIRWLVFEQSEGRYGLARARVKMLEVPTPLAQLGTLEESQAIGKSALGILETQLAKSQWLAEGITPTIADIACYPYTAMATQGGILLDHYPAIQRWFKDIRNLPGYIDLPG